MKVHVRIALLILPLLLLTGCAGYRPWAKKVGAFSNQTAPALAQMKTTFTAAGNLHDLEQETVLIQHYDTDGYRPGQLSSLMDQNALKARESAISTLENYAALVGDLASGKRINVPNPPKAATSSTAMSTKSQSTATTDTVNAATKITTTVTNSQTMTQQQLNMAVSGLDLILKPIVEHKVHAQLAPLMKQADPAVQKVCTLLEADLSDLKSQEDEDYSVLLMDQARFVSAHAQTLDPVAKRAELQKLYDLERAKAQTDDSLAATADALKGLSQAHARIVSGEAK